MLRRGGGHEKLAEGEGGVRSGGGTTKHYHRQKRQPVWPSRKTLFISWRNWFRTSIGLTFFLLSWCCTSTVTIWLLRDGERMGQGLRTQAHILFTQPATEL